MTEAGVPIKDEPKAEPETERVKFDPVFGPFAYDNPIINSRPFPTDNPYLSNFELPKYCPRCGKQVTCIFDPASRCHILRCLKCAKGEVFDMKFRIVEQCFQ
jgi:hypothetical protein